MLSTSTFGFMREEDVSESRISTSGFTDSYKREFSHLVRDSISQLLSSALFKTAVLNLVKPILTEIVSASKAQLGVMLADVEARVAQLETMTAQQLNNKTPAATLTHHKISEVIERSDLVLKPQNLKACDLSTKFKHLSKVEDTSAKLHKSKNSRHFTSVESDEKISTRNDFGKSLKDVESGNRKMSSVLLNFKTKSKVQDYRKKLQIENKTMILQNSQARLSSLEETSTAFGLNSSQIEKTAINSTASTHAQRILGSSQKKSRVNTPVKQSTSLFTSLLIRRSPLNQNEDSEPMTYYLKEVDRKPYSKLSLRFDRTNATMVSDEGPRENKRVSSKPPSNRVANLLENQRAELEEELLISLGGI